MLDLTATRNTAVITMHGETHEIYYRTPTTQEIVRFQAEAFVRKGKHLVNRSVEARLKFGALVLTGFKPGTIGVGGKLISSDPDDKDHYYEQWRELLVSGAPQLVIAVGMAAFESVRLGAEDPMQMVEDMLGGAEEAADSTEDATPTDAASTGGKKPGKAASSPLARG